MVDLLSEAIFPSLLSKGLVGFSKQSLLCNWKKQIIASTNNCKDFSLSFISTDSEDICFSEEDIDEGKAE